ncbi:hypothetical protein TNCV_119741 [Trichonephila clavipes]|nr:hypothetical protein TNCV_119741 [Trichonephila clavipes]
MFKNCRKEDLRIVALELEDRKRADEDSKRKRIEEDRQKEAENRLRENKLELEIAHLNVRVKDSRYGKHLPEIDFEILIFLKSPN